MCGSSQFASAACEQKKKKQHAQFTERSEGDK